MRRSIALLIALAPAVSWAQQAQVPPPFPPSADVRDHTHWMEWWRYNQDALLFRDVVPLPGELEPNAERRAQIADALQQSLNDRKPGDEVVVGEILLQLAGYGVDAPEARRLELVRVIETYLCDPHPTIRERAALALGRLGSAESVGVLADLALNAESARIQTVDGDIDVAEELRAFAIFGLGLIGESCTDEQVRRDVVNVLWQVCEGPPCATPDVKSAAVLSMGLVPLEYSPANVVAALTETLDPRTHAPRTRVEQVRYLTDIFVNETSTRIRDLGVVHAPRSIARLIADAPQLKPTVVKALLPYVSKRGNVGIREKRQAASLALGQLGDLDDDPEDQAIRKALLEATVNADQMVKSFSIIALGELGSQPGSGTHNQGGELEVRSHLIMQLQKGKVVQKSWAALALGLMESGLQARSEPSSFEGVDALRSALLASKSDLDISGCALALGLMRDETSELALIQKLHTVSDVDAKSQVAMALALLRLSSALESLEDLHAALPSVVPLADVVTHALATAGDLKTIAQMSQRFDRWGSTAEREATLASLARALPFVRDSRWADVLLKELKDPTLSMRARKSVVIGLGALAASRAPSWNARFAVGLNYTAITWTMTGYEAAPGLLDVSGWREAPEPGPILKVTYSGPDGRSHGENTYPAPRLTDPTGSSCSSSLPAGPR